MYSGMTVLLLLKIKRNQKRMDSLHSSRYFSVTFPVEGHLSWLHDSLLSLCPVFNCFSKTRAYPCFNVVFPSLILSSTPSCSIGCTLKNCLCKAGWAGGMAISSQFPFLYYSGWNYVLTCTRYSLVTIKILILQSSSINNLMGNGCRSSYKKLQKMKSWRLSNNQLH